MAEPVGDRMNLVRSLRQRESDAAELMDRPGHPPATLAANLRDLRRANRWFGGTGLTHRALSVLLGPGEQTPPAKPSTEPIRILDVGTGGADIPATLAAR